MATEKQQVMESINPATGEVLGRFPLFASEQIDRALDDAQRAFRSWREASFDDRADVLRRVAEYLRSHKTPLASLITAEMGKPIVQAEAEIEKCAWNCGFFAENAARFLADEPHPSTSAESYVAFDPLGVALAIMPWNFPFWQVFRFAAPALMAGNTAVLKHSSNVPQCALAVEEVFRASGLPEGVFRTLLISGATATKLIADPRIAAVTLTGSDATGAQVAMAAGNVVKKTVLELGGSDPFLVLEDADLDAAAQYAARSRYQNGGQSCVSAKRFIVMDSVADTFLQSFVAKVAALKVGNPAERTTDVGPLARDDLRDALDRQVRESVAQGARVVLGGRPLVGPGYFYAPTILADVTPPMPAFSQETFGPVAAVTRVGSVEEAISMANATRYGLGANLWTKDIERAKRLAGRIEAGSVFINGMVASDPRLPFGGVKRSGYGRELSEFGIREFSNIKTIWIGAPAESRPPQAPSE
jgi:succinate-semialdehyde dehydrogenase/glutarate-semialdehyde dehydrogenase